jgi:uroporphyrin-III C-methyltransferase
MSELNLILPHKAPFAAGEVALVGAGPGDPELLTLQALRFIRQADVVIYDRLVGDEIMALVPEHCQRIYVGKKQANHRVPQPGINALLVEYAQKNNKVVRLKGGDPFIFGRGGEEAEYLAGYNIPCHIVPGVTAAAGCSAYAGIPLTHRGMATNCRFITGHLENGEELNLSWKNLAEHQQTLVFYMGVKSLPIISEQLQRHGLSANTPAALIENGTKINQRVYRGDLNSLPSLVSRYQIKPPTLIVIGDVVNALSNSEIAVAGYFANQQQSS